MFGHGLTWAHTGCSIPDRSQSEPGRNHELDVAITRRSPLNTLVLDHDTACDLLASLALVLGAQIAWTFDRPVLSVETASLLVTTRKVATRADEITFNGD
jgi:hypothetical protein